MTQLALMTGTGRSGTTVFQQALIEAASAAFVPRLTGRIGRLAALARSQRYGFADNRWLSPSAESTGLLERFGLRASLVRELGRPIKRGDVEQSSIRGLETFLDRLAGHAGRETVVMKSTASSNRLEAYHHFVTPPKLVHVVRHPAFVSESLVRTDFFPSMTPWWLGKQVSEVAADADALLQLAARHWREQTQTVLDSREQFSWHQVRAEDFAQDPRLVLSQAVEFLGTPADEHSIERGASLLDPNALSRKVTDLDPDRTRIVEAECGDLMTQFGYGLLHE